nr:hypothetical protein [uncultured Deefgea sp.]
MTGFTSDDVRALLTAGGMEFVADRCKQLGISQPTYYRRVNVLIQAYQYWNEHKNEHKRHPLQENVLELVLAHPDWGCSRIAKALDNQVTPPTIQAILQKNGLATKNERALHIHNLLKIGSLEQPSQEQIKALFKAGLLTPDLIPQVATQSHIDLIGISLGKHTDGQHYLVVAIVLPLRQLHHSICVYKSKSFSNYIDISRCVWNLINDAKQKTAIFLSHARWSKETLGVLLSRNMEMIQSFGERYSSNAFFEIKNSQADVVSSEIKQLLRKRLIELKQEYGNLTESMIEKVIDEFNTHYCTDKLD